MGIELQRAKKLICQNKLKFSNLSGGSGTYSPITVTFFSLSNVSNNCNYNSSRLEKESSTLFPCNPLYANHEFKNSGNETLFQKCNGLLKSLTKAKKEGELFALKAMQMVFDRLANSSLSNFNKDIPIAGKLYLFTRMKNLICW